MYSALDIKYTFIRHQKSVRSIHGQKKSTQKAAQFCRKTADLATLVLNYIAGVKACMDMLNNSVQIIHIKDIHLVCKGLKLR